jgi:hypothetical protein
LASDVVMMKGWVGVVLFASASGGEMMVWTLLLLGVLSGGCRPAMAECLGRYLDAR